MPKPLKKYSSIIQFTVPQRSGDPNGVWFRVPIVLDAEIWCMPTVCTAHLYASFNARHLVNGGPNESTPLIFVCPFSLIQRYPIGAVYKTRCRAPGIYVGKLFIHHLSLWSDKYV